MTRVLLPVDGIVTSRRGKRWGRVHQGIDISVPPGTPVHAPLPWNKALYFYEKDGGGHVLVLTYSVPLDDGRVVPLRMRFMHLRTRPTVKASGRKHDIIAHSGNSGHSTGPHLHFDIAILTKKGPLFIDPLSILPKV